MKLFNDWKGLLIMCPEAVDDTNLHLQGIISGMKSSHISFQVRRCDPKKRKPGELPCRTNDEIDEYIRDLQIDTEILNQKIDFNVYD